MPANIPNVTIPQNTWVDLYAATGVQVGQAISVENVGTCDVYLAIQATKPTQDHDAYNIIKRKGPSLQNSEGDEGAWAFCQGGESKVSVREAKPPSGFYANGVVPTDFLVEVGRGNVPGITSGTVVSRIPSTSSGVFEDIWSGGGKMVFPIAAETWEVVSDNDNDTSGGTGGNLVVVNYLDDQYVQQSIVAPLSGKAPVILNSDHFRPAGMTVIFSGSSQVNEGKITLRVAGGGNIRNVIGVGLATSNDCHFTVPAGKKLLTLSVEPYIPKNQDITLKGVVIPFGSNTRITNGVFNFYQNAFALDFKALFPAPEKTDLSFEIMSSNEGADISHIFEYLLLDV